MEKYKISEEQADLYKRFLTTEDYDLIAEISGFSVSTVNNILGRRTKVNSENQKVIAAFNQVLKLRVDETVKWIHEAERELAMSLLKNVKIV